MRMAFKQAFPFDANCILIGKAR